MKHGIAVASLVAALGLIWGCSTQVTPEDTQEVVAPGPTELQGDEEMEIVGDQEEPGTVTAAAVAADLAHVISVRAQGQDGDYSFSVGISSPDEGCQQYADWWEILDGNGELIYRRVLLHSHVSEQPFTRSGGPVDIAATDAVVVRAHMNPGGYGGTALEGSVAMGFQEVELPQEFSAGAANLQPLPDGCNS